MYFVWGLFCFAIGMALVWWSKEWGGGNVALFLGIIAFAVGAVLLGIQKRLWRESWQKYRQK